MPNPSFKRTSQGPIIRRLQQKLFTVKPDGVYGRLTQQAVRSMQTAEGLEPTGNASQLVFGKLNLAWPDWFLRCMNLTSALEDGGKGFGAINTTDIDDWGITLGIVGFTSRNGEVQALFKQLLQRHPNAVMRFESVARRDEFNRLVASKFPNLEASNRAWSMFAYGATGGRLRDDFEDFVVELGEDRVWQGIQLDAARVHYWEPAVAQAKALGITSMRGHGLLYDLWVQNGGWRTCHKNFYLSQSHDSSEDTKLRAIARAAANCATATWREDVLKRKMIFVETAGFAHGSYFDLTYYAFEGVD